MLVPKDGYWMDPLALFRGGEMESKKLQALSDTKKLTPFPYKTTDGRLAPADTKLVWPFACQAK
ncbi:MAG: hypothetical protein QGF09_17890 [Rhodospirillales bacterium]|nr:hypothetical protein [Rhodospirillales bacterium]